MEHSGSVFIPIRNTRGIAARYYYEVLVPGK